MAAVRIHLQPPEVVGGERSVRSAHDSRGARAMPQDASAPLSGPFPLLYHGNNGKPDVSQCCLNVPGWEVEFNSEKL